MRELTDSEKTILENHELWLIGEGGERANLSDANLSGADLRGANLSRANLGGADLRGANLSGANLSGANLRGANLSRANLSGANLGDADLGGADLSGANLGDADLGGADLSGANLSRADLGDANLNYANLRDANLSGADLSGAQGLLDATAWIRENFETDEFGIIVYKTFGQTYDVPNRWSVQPGSFITEECNPCRVSDCACGVNFATLEWCQRFRPGKVIWKLRIHWIDLVSVVVPYHTDGKARGGRLEILEELPSGEEEVQ